MTAKGIGLRLQRARLTCGTPSFLPWGMNPRDGSGPAAGTGPTIPLR